jgi:hypothetical protein
MVEILSSQIASIDIDNFILSAEMTFLVGCDVQTQINKKGTSQDEKPMPA